jgi:hypothetical protein
VKENILPQNVKKREKIHKGEIGVQTNKNLPQRSQRKNGVWGGRERGRRGHAYLPCMFVICRLRRQSAKG